MTENKVKSAADAAMYGNDDETRVELAADQEPAVPISAAAAAADSMDGDDFEAAAAALRDDYSYRRLGTFRPEDDFAEGAQHGRDSALHELETGLAAAAHGPPHKGAEGSEDSEVSEDGEDRLHNANSISSSLDTEEVVAFALECDEEEEQENGAGGHEELVSSSYSANFQGAHDASRSNVSLAAYFADSAKDMLTKDERARKEADMYMAEVTLATKMLPLTFSMAFQQTFFFDRVWSGSTGRAGP